ncbi:Crp/Fnr family transcriptional regulator [Enterococcus faecium]|nr:Crp/Fnr family transcriptional regulator [Enterococcus faecium]PWS25046.1 Crp/Fnr family transcriptional regulator [Enterococcus faecium]
MFHVPHIVQVLCFSFWIVVMYNEYRAWSGGITMVQDLYKLLQSSNLCNGLTSQQIELLIKKNAVKLISYKHNEILYWTDEIPEKLYMLVTGNIAMAKDTIDGKRILSKGIQTFGDLSGEVRLFSNQKLLWDYCIALENSSVIEIDSRIILNRNTLDAEIQLTLLRNIIGNLIEKIDLLGQKVKMLSTPSVRERIALYFASVQTESGEITLELRREDMADYLGITRPSLSRELGKMKDDGIIDIVGHKIRILNQVAFDDLLE